MLKDMIIRQIVLLLIVLFIFTK